MDDHDVYPVVQPSGQHPTGSQSHPRAHIPARYLQALLWTLAFVCANVACVVIGADATRRTIAAAPARTIAAAAAVCNAGLLLAAASAAGWALAARFAQAADVGLLSSVEALGWPPLLFSVSTMLLTWSR